MVVVRGKGFKLVLPTQVKVTLTISSQPPPPLSEMQSGCFGYSIYRHQATHCPLGQ